MQRLKHLGVYGILISNEKILLIKKANGPYKGMLDLPGGSLEYKERPIDTLKREFKEETNLNIKNFSLLDADSIYIERLYDELYTWHHVCIFYKINDYEGDIKDDISINEINDDSLGANFYEIKNLKKKDVSEITVLALEKLGYNLK